MDTSVFETVKDYILNRGQTLNLGESLSGVYEGVSYSIVNWDCIVIHRCSSSEIRKSFYGKNPCVFLNVVGQVWDFWNPNDLHPWPLLQSTNDPKLLDFYVDWPWQWIRSDCFTLLRAYYQGVLGIHINDYDRESEDEFSRLVSENKWNRYIENLPKEGFIQIADSSNKEDVLCNVNDVILFKGIGQSACHLGIYVKPGILLTSWRGHKGQRSKLEPYDNRLLRMTHSVWRHEKTCLCDRST